MNPSKGYELYSVNDKLGFVEWGYGSDTVTLWSMDGPKAAPLHTITSEEENEFILKVIITPMNGVDFAIVLTTHSIQPFKIEEEET
jgi:hypothetical protein